MLCFDIEHPLDDGGELQAADDERVGPRAVHRHDLATGDSEVVRGLGGDLRVGQILVAHQGAVGAQDEVAATPIFDVLAALKQPALLDDLPQTHVDVFR